MPTPPNHLDNLRRWRAGPGKDLTIGGEMGSLIKQVRAQVRGLSDAADVWRTVVPQDLGSECRLISVKRGVLAVVAPNASVRYRLDSWLRAGGEKALASASRGVTKVKLTV
ncbi:MAG: DUF721 domain-containing protein [Phycisphaerales bacterium]|jgi:hypothetical protein|nr:DUF721 domain-containing protein [Phycisphaerales bacterium]